MRPGTRRSLTFGAAAMLAVTAFATAPVGAQEADVPQGGILVVGEWQSAEQLNPYLTNALKDQEGSWPISRGLATIDNAGQFVPEFLTEYPTLENGGVVPDEDGDGFTLNLKMQEGLMWSDGTPLTLHDFKANYDWAVAVGALGSIACAYCPQMAPLIDASLPPETLYAPENQRVEALNVSDDGLTAEVIFTSNYAGWSGLLTQPLIDTAYWAEVPAEELATRAVLGSASLLEIPVNGPFKIVAASSDGIDYAPNEYWTADSGPNLEQLRLRFFGDKAGMFAAFLDGSIDLTLNTTPADFPTLQTVDPSIGKAQNDTGWLYEHLDFNTERADKGLDDPVVRQALRMAVDWSALVEVLFPGAGMTRACSISPPNVWWASDVECAPYDPEAAAAMLDEAGWVIDPETGFRAKDGNPLRPRLCTSSGNPVRLTTLGRVAQDWDAIGVPADIQTEDRNIVFASYDLSTPEDDCNIYRGNFDAAVYTSQLSGDPYGNYYFNYHSTQPASETNRGGIAITRLSDPEMDAALEVLGTKIDPEGIKAAADTIHQLVNELSNEVPIYYRPEPVGVSNHLGGFGTKNPSTATALWDVENWYFIP